MDLQALAALAALHQQSDLGQGVGAGGVPPAQKSGPLMIDGCTHGLHARHGSAQHTQHARRRVCPIARSKQRKRSVKAVLL
jgi:hypothetical protein